MRVLVINAGSSSLKYQLLDMDGESCLAQGMVESIGGARPLHRLARPALGQPQETTQAVEAPGHPQALALLWQALAGLPAPQAIGHRVVHGGALFGGPARITPEVEEAIQRAASLAPLHNPHNLAAIRLAASRFPRLPQVAVFDTAFFNPLPPQSARYAVPEVWFSQYGVRRYGFHGTSHQYVATEAARLMGRPLETVKLITLHLGAGASAAAIQGGVPIDTSMGLTPLEGLVMATRPGDLDVGLLFYLRRVAGLSEAELEKALTHGSGLAGLCGQNDMREIHRLADGGEPKAGLARQVYVWRLRKYLGGYLALLEGADGLVFTGGVGENDPWSRWHATRGLERLGVAPDPQANQSRPGGAFSFHLPHSPTQLWVVPTREELQIARLTLLALGENG